MARNVSTGSMKARPSAISSAKSFTRFEPSKTSLGLSRNRASTVQGRVSPIIPEAVAIYSTSPEEASRNRTDDVFEKTNNDDDEASGSEMDRSISHTQSLPERFDELPIELKSLTDRFVESLGAKVWAEPPTADIISELFQEFYVKAASHISTHISTLSSRLNRTASPTPTLSSKTKPDPTQPSKDSIDTPTGTSGGQQMLTASEVGERRKARRLLEFKRVALEEAVEKRACEQVYDKIWRHKSTLDEMYDEKLRSKTAALALVGIGLRDLGIDIDTTNDKTEDDVRVSLAPATEGLAKMNNEKFPRGKLQHLTSAHKSIVETLSTIHPSSSSADEILPTLIYTLISAPVEGINIISNLYFIQRFRAISKIDGEAAYCMTNLEAAISFLENVDLASLRADEVPEGPPKSASRPSTPMAEIPEFSFPTKMPPPTSHPTIVTTSVTTSVTTLQAPSTSDKPISPIPSPMHQRRLSNLLQPSAKAIGAANDAVRSSAEEGLRNITATLDNSFKFLFGRLQQRSTSDNGAEVVLPKTLDEARQLVGRPLAPEDESLLSETSSIAESHNDATKSDDKLLGMASGRRAMATAPTRDRSVDSTKSNGSGKRVAFAAAGSTSNLAAPPQNSSSVPVNALESVKSLGNTLNPLNHLGSAFGTGFRGFGKAAASPSVLLGKDRTPPPEPSPAASAFKGPLDGTVSITPPIQRFLDMTDSGELKLKDVTELLHDYQRLAKALKNIGHG